MSASATVPVPRPASAAEVLAGRLIGPATAVMILAAALLLLMTPPWMHFALGASGSGTFLATPEQVFSVSDRTIWELFVGPGTFTYSTAPGPVLFSPDEAAHLRDVRTVLLAFLAIALASAALVAWRILREPRDPRTWRSIARGGAALASTLAVLGVFAALAFGVAFELFHRILFPGGNWAFPDDSLLIRLYPYGFWQLTAGALAVLGIGGGLLVWAGARRRARTLEARAAT